MPSFESGLALASKTSKKTKKLAKGGLAAQQKRFAPGGEVAESPMDYLNTSPNFGSSLDTTPKGALNQLSAQIQSGGDKATTKQAERDQKMATITGATDKLNTRLMDRTGYANKLADLEQNILTQNEARKAQLQAQLDPNSEDAKWRKAERLFELSAALGAPVQRGSGFSGFIQNVGKAGAGYSKSKREEKKELDLVQKEMNALGADPRLLQLMKESHALTQPSSAFGKQALDEGLTPNTLEFNARVKQLHKEELDTKRLKASGNTPASGAFDKKTGNYITDSGVVIKASEVGKDREKIQALSDLQNRLSDLSPKKLKDAESWLDQTSGIGKAIGSRLGTKAFKAQTEIQASGIQEVLQNLPPGPASDKDIAQAKSSFPGYGDAEALSQWVERTQKMIERKQGQFTNKYGSENWWGESGASGAAAKKSDGKPAEGEKKPSKIKAGYVEDGYRFKGGDPNVQSNWEKV